ncbi:MAG: fructosamine kinase [SAR324 cluster bacterium]|uniref:Fructosamine kinase n=1 Tax=SAR324 cluster bacterium TaxID=2024889 RepID=A0A2A4SSA2_9DELT|nr:MAG: fructosamine kinase [SAR324 cluster bacterium]
MGGNEGIRKRIESWAGESIHTSSAITGGCIAQASRITMQSGVCYFLKTGATSEYMFLKEARSLRELCKPGVIRVPTVFLADPEFLLMEYVAPKSAESNFFECFGRAFAELHRYQQDQFGFFEDNFIGATPQKNIPTKQQANNWVEFFFQKRLLFQYQLAEEKGLANEAMRKGFQQLERKIESILSGSQEPPSLLHGDLWSGNFLVDEQANACLIDPAVYYGHREADLAMTKLFGGFSPAFYQAYEESYALAPGHEYRENIYLLYHVMNHLNLFGPSYYGQAMELISSYLR